MLGYLMMALLNLFISTHDNLPSLFIPNAFWIIFDFFLQHTNPWSLQLVDETCSFSTSWVLSLAMLAHVVDKDGSRGP